MADPASTGLTFLSWYRSGLSAGVAAPAGGPPLDTRPPAAVVASVRMTLRDPDDPSPAPGDVVTTGVSVRLHAPADVVGLDTAQIVRTDPPAGATNVPPDCFPLVEFARPDVPWMLSPTGPQTNLPTDADPRRGLTPWLCLVVAPEPPSALDAPATPGALPTVTLPNRELPDPATTWLWAHVQVSTPAADSAPIPELIAQDPARALSRLVAPRRLQPDTAYLACVVPTFAADDGSGTLGPAWPHGDPQATVTLPVYHSWRFTTGPAGDFRTLVRRLRHGDLGGVGVRPMDVGDAGDGMPAPAAGQAAWTIALEGALVGADVLDSVGTWSDPAVRDALAAALAARLAASATELAPPTYGAVPASYPGSLSATDSPTWLRTLNLDPRYRAAAAFGADLVRTRQEALVLAAWDQAGQVREANQVLRQGQLAQEIAVTAYTGRIGAPTAATPPMSDDLVLALTRGVHADVPAGSPVTPAAAEEGGRPPTVADALAANATAAAVVGLPYRRLTRRAGPFAARLFGPPLPPALSSVALPHGITPIPPLTPVSGMIDLTALSHDPTAPENLRGLTAARVGAPTLPWEHPPAPRPAAAADVRPADLLLQPGYLADLLVVDSSLGRALDWDGRALAGWDTPAVIGTSGGVAGLRGGVEGKDWNTFIRVPGGGAASLISWNDGHTPADPAIVLAQGSVRPGEDPGEQGKISYSYTVDVTATLRGDLIPGVANSPVQQQPAFPGSGAELVWPSVTVGGFRWSPGRYEQDPGGGAFPDGPQPLPPIAVTTAVATGDLTGSGAPSIALVWSVDCQGPPTTDTGVHVTVLVDVNTVGVASTRIDATIGFAAPDVQGAAVANRRLFVLSGRQLLSAPIDAAARTLGPFRLHTAWTRALPADWVWATLTAADFTGQGRADLLFLYALRIVDTVGATACRAGYRVAYDLDANGDPGYWSDEIDDAPIAVSERSTSLVLGPLTPQTVALRQATSAAFRTAATATQGRIAAVVPAVASPPPPPPVDPAPASLAAALRVALDPRVTVPVGVLGKLQLSAPPPAGADALQPVGFVPSFPAPLSDALPATALSRLVPGLSHLPDESITVLAVDRRVVEAVLVGANHELGRELRWRRVPAERTGTFFTRFWDQRDADGNPLPGVTEIASWTATSDLGDHPPPSDGGTPAVPVDAAVLLIRGELIRRFPHVTIYAAPAVGTGSSRTVDIAHRIDPQFSGTPTADMVYVGFPFSTQTARSSADSPGLYFVFQEHPMAPRFGLDLDDGTPTRFGRRPAVWRDLTWADAVPDADAYATLSYLDASASSTLWGAALPDTAPGGTAHRWGFSAAHMAHIAYRPPVLIAIHADDLLKVGS